MKRLLFLLISCCVLQVVTLKSQTPTATPTPTTDDGVVKITTTLIQIDATVLDKNGKPVKGLTAEDFEIFENGKKQQITNFSLIELQPGTSSQPLTNQPNSSGITTTVPPTSGLSYNQVRRTLALVVDDLGLSFASTEWVKRALRKFVDEQIQPGDLAAIIRTSSGVGALQQFTTDKRLLHLAIDRIRWSSRGRTGVSTFSPIEPTTGEVENNAPDITGRSGMKQIAGLVEEREMKRDAQEAQEAIFASGTLGAVNFVMRGMGQLPGRKAVILFSDGFKLFSRKGSNTRVQESLQQLTDTANRSGVIIYTVDAKGLDAPMLTAEDDTFGLDSTQVDERLEVRSKDFLDTQQSLRYVAEQTGGFAIINQNDLSKGVGRILDDQKSFYLIGYQPDEDIFDIEKRRFNKLTVKVNRPGLRVRYRSGFFGITDNEAKPQPKNAVQQLIAALTSPFTSKDIDLRLTSLFASDSSYNPFMRSLIYIKAGDLTFKPEKDDWFKAEFDVSVLTFGDTGEVIDQINRRQSVRVQSGSLQNLYKEGLVCFVTLPIQKPGAYQMRVALRDAETGRIGSATQFIEVPNLKKKNLVLSGVALERVETKKSNSLADAKILELKMQRDAAIRRFRTGEIIRFGFSIYNAKIDKSAGNPSLTMQYKIFSNGKEIFAGPEKPLDTGRLQSYQVIDAVGGFSLGSNLPPGDYVVQVIIKDLLAPQKRQTATQWTDFEIVP